MDVKEAKRLDALEKKLISKFRAAESEERKERAKTAADNPVVPTSGVGDEPPFKVPKLSLPFAILPPPPPPPRTTLQSTRPQQQQQLVTVTKAKQLESLGSRLQHEFAEVHATEMAEQHEREKKYEAITKAIRQKKEQDAEAELKAKEWLRKQRYNQIVNRLDQRGGRRFTPSVTSTPERIGYIGASDDVGDEDKMEIEDAAAAAPPVSLPNKSMKQLLDSRVVNLGVVGTRYLPKANDNRFGIYYDEEAEQLKIGSVAITFDYDDILVKGKRYKGTEGLWRLLTSKGAVPDDKYTGEDWTMYKDMLLATNSLYQKNDPNSKRPKASQSTKWKQMIRPIWEEDIKKTSVFSTATGKEATPPPPPPPAAAAATVSDDDDGEDGVVMIGSGLKEYNERPIEYRYINNLNELINRLNYIYAQETAGNRSFTNEKLSVVKFIHDRMEELVRRPNGLKYLLRCLSALPQHVIEGSGLLNDMINKLPFELHAPSSWTFDTYNYCGPGTKLDMRLARGDKGINPLDEACKKHDLWYRDHKNAEERWVADKALQKAAWDRVTSLDAGLNERAVGLATTGAMWLKRKLGMGLGTSSCVQYK